MTNNKPYNPTLDSRALALNNKILVNAIHSQPWMEQLIDYLPELWEKIPAIVLGAYFVDISSKGPLPRITIRAGGHPDKKWYGYTVADMSSNTIWKDAQAFVGWLPVNESTMITGAATYSIATGEMAADKDHFGSLSPWGLSWNHMLAKAALIQSHYPDDFKRMVRVAKDNPALLRGASHIVSIMSDTRNWRKADIV